MRIIQTLTALSFCGFILLGTIGCGTAQRATAMATRAVGVATLKPLWKCLPEGTKIDTPTGPKAVESLVAGEVVIGYEGQPVKAIHIHSYMEEPDSDRFYRVTFENGAEVNLCDKHRINGVPAEQLKVGDKLQSGHVVKSISTYGNVVRSYDLLTEDKGYQIGGVPVNSMIEEMYESGRNGEI